jgi:hypothetical protein
LAIVFLTRSSYAIGVYDFKSLADIYRDYQLGGFDSTQYQLLMESYDLGGLDENDLIAIGVFDPLEVFMADDTLFADNLWQQFMTGGFDRIGFRTYSYPSGKAFNNYYLNFSQYNLAIAADVKSNQDKYSFNRRSVSYKNANLDLTLGNYLAREGYGLTVGRFDYLPSAGFHDSADFDFWRPVNSFYNGLKIQLSVNNLNGRFYYSAKQYGDAIKQFYGSGADYSSDQFSIGATLGANHFHRGQFEDQKLAAGINFKLILEQYEFGGEFARVNRSGGIYLAGMRYLSVSNIKLALWHYADHFNSYNCSGMASTDYRTFYLDDQDIGFRTSQAGETGFASNFIGQRFAIGWQVWQQAHDDNIKFLAASRWSITIADQATWLSQIHYSNKSNKENFWLKTGIGKTRLPMLNWFGVKLESDGKRWVNDQSYGFLEMRYAIQEKLNLGLHMRPYFNGKFYWLLSENAKLNGGFQLNMNLIIRDGLRINLTFEKSL